MKNGVTLEGRPVWHLTDFDSLKSWIESGGLDGSFNEGSYQAAICNPSGGIHSPHLHA